LPPFQVDLDVEALDKGDNFIGSLFVNKSNLAVSLLSEGLAQVIEGSAERSKYRDELYAAEKEAKQAKKGMWKNWVPPTDSDEKDKASGLIDPSVFENRDFTCNITEIQDAAHFFIQFTADPSMPYLLLNFYTFPLMLLYSLQISKLSQTP
jgi:hypothetical protein